MESGEPFMVLRSRQPASGDGVSIRSADSAYGSASENCPAATHDISRVSYHVKHLDSFAQALQESAGRAFPNRGQANQQQRYSRVHALMLHWGSDDLFVMPELEDLEKCFRERYCFETTIFSIPSENSHLELMLKVGDMVKQYERKDTLLVIYYAGHARIDESRQSTWCANRQPGSPWLQWSAIQTLLERSISDVLILLDCCAGAAAAGFPHGESITETISASSWDAIAPDPGRYSFTNCLIEVLEEWRQRTFSAAMLHAEVLARLKHPRPILINGKPFEARSTPVHFMMTSNHRAPSIEICRVKRRSRLPPMPHQQALPYHHPNTSHMALEGSRFIDPYAPPPEDLTPQTDEPNEDNPHVMISLALEDDQRLDLKAWETWLAGFPALAKYVKVQGVFKSHSTLLLLSLPITVWDMLPDDPACSFVAFIRSNNLIRTPAEPSAETVDASVGVAAENSQPSRSEQPWQAGGTSVGGWAEQGSAGAADAESLEGSTLNPTLDSDLVEDISRVARPSLHRPLMTSIRSQDERSSVDTSAQLGPGSHPIPSITATTTYQVSVPPPGTLSKVASSATSLLERQHSPTDAVPQQPELREGISRTLILNKSRGSKKSFFASNQDLPQGHKLARHVEARLEHYYSRVPDPSVAYIEHLASNLGVETSDVHLWFHHRREQEKLNHNLMNLQATGSHQQVQARAFGSRGAHMILPGHLNALLEIYPSKNVLIVDLRSATDFERSHIHEAINLRAPLTFVQNVSLEMIEDTFMDDQSRRNFGGWSRCQCVVFYDRVIEFDWECPVAEALCDKFRAKGWKGQCFILKGHYREFSTSFDRHISGSRMTEEGKAYLDGLRGVASETQDEVNKRHERYDEWLRAFMSQYRPPVTDLRAVKKLEKLRDAEEHQRELETEFETRFPALYKKAKAMGSRPAASGQHRSSSSVTEPPSPLIPPGSPPPPFHSKPWESRPFRAVDWSGGVEQEEPRTKTDDGDGYDGDGDDDCDLTKGHFVERLVGPLASGLEKMRNAATGGSAERPINPQAETYVSGKSKLDIYADENDYDEIDPKSEGLRNDPGFQKAGSGPSEPAVGGMGQEAHGGTVGGGGEESTKKTKKKTQFWERIRTGGK